MVTELVTAGKIEVGAPFPQLSLPTMEEGQALSVADFRGQELILHIWASW